MKKHISLALCLILAGALTACGGAKEGSSSSAAVSAASEAVSTSASSQAETEWPRDAFYTNEEEYYLSVMWMDGEEGTDKGWYVGLSMGEDNYGGVIDLADGVLSGELPALEGDPVTVKVSQEGADGALLEIEGGETYHFKEEVIPEATVFTNINIEGMGSIAYAEGETTPEIDEEFPSQSAVLNLEEPAVYTILAQPSPGWKFVKWTKNGEDFSTDAQFTAELSGTAEYIAVFEEDEDWVNPVAVCEGVYYCDRARAEVSVMTLDASVLITWGGSASEAARWTLWGPVDPETLTLTYEYGQKAGVVYNEDGDIEEEDVEYEDGTGTIVFEEDGSGFTWHDDKGECEGMVFERAPEEEE